MFAIIKVSGKQYNVTKDAVIDVDLLTAQEGDQLDITDVLLRGDEAKVEIGTPFVKGAKVIAKVMNHLQGEKINVRRYKSKVRYRKSMGFRAQLTRLQIVSIS